MLFGLNYLEIGGVVLLGTIALIAILLIIATGVGLVNTFLDGRDQARFILRERSRWDALYFIWFLEKHNLPPTEESWNKYVNLPKEEQENTWLK